MASIPRPLHTLLSAAWWAAATMACLTTRARSRLRRPRHGPRYGFGLHPDAVHITAGVHILHTDTDGRAAYLTLRASPDNPVLITTARELAAAMTSWKGAPPPRTRPHRAGIEPPHPAEVEAVPSPATLALEQT